MGYDTVNLWLPAERAGGNNRLSYIPSKLKNYTECKKGDELYTTGNLDNYLVYVSRQGISLKGSLSKWFLGDNIQDLSRKDTKIAIEKLSDELGLPLSKAKVKRVDFGYVFNMKQKTKSYYTHLGHLRYFERLEQPNSINYLNSRRSLIFYDKIAECKANRVYINKTFLNKNLLRYEIRFMKELSKIFNQTEIKLSDLYLEDFYRRIVDEWVNQYLLITKIKKIKFKDNVKFLPKEIIEQLTLIGIMNVGYQSVLDMIKEMKSKGQFEYSKYVNRVIEMVKTICNNPLLTESSELIEELTSNIKRVQRNCC